MLSRLALEAQHLWRQFPALLPSHCALCATSNEHVICDACRGQFFQRRVHCCIQCAMPLLEITGETALRCGACLDQPPAYDATYSAVDYAAPIDQLVVSLKFRSRLALAPMFARLMRDHLLASGMTASQQSLPNLLIPVPLSAQRLSQRGFNQALEIARPLSRTLGVPLEPRLAVRLRNTNAQSSLHPDERRKNMRNAFTISPAFVDRLRDQHVGIVDDVMTTGETLNELAATLKRFGATRVTNFVFARTLLK